MPTILELQAGTYTVSAESSGEDKVAWDNAIYGGTKDFSIVVGSVSNVELICSLTNMKVSVKCSDNFLSELSDFEITVSNEFGNLTWERGDIERSGYFPVAPLEVRVKGYRAIDNSVAYSSIQINEVAARDHHILNLDAVTTGELNTSDSFITIDPGLNDREENVDVPGFDETPAPGGGEDPEPEEPAIVVEWPANPDFAPMEITQDMDVDLTIKAPAGIKTFVVNIESEALAQLGITKLDLVNPGDFKDIADMILEGQSLEDATEVSLKLSGLVPLLGATPGNHTFNLVMSDNDGNTLEKTAVFYVSE